jgi:hypothetical protein
MKGMILGCIFAVTQILSVTLAQDPKSTSEANSSQSVVQLVISPENIAVLPDNKDNLSIKWINKTNQNVDCLPNFTSGQVDEKYIYDVRVRSGASVPRVAGKRAPNYLMISPCGVAPGQSVEMTIGCVMCAFDMRHPGVYTVQVSLPDPSNPGHMFGTSNKVTITVKAQ